MRIIKFLDYRLNRENRMNKAKGLVDRIKIGLLIGLLTALTGCAGYGGEPYYYGDTVVVSEPDMYVFGGYYDNGRDAHNYSHRGSQSRGAVHHGGSPRAAHSNNVKGGRR